MLYIIKIYVLQEETEIFFICNTYLWNGYNYIFGVNSKIKN